MSGVTKTSALKKRQPGCRSSSSPRPSSSSSMERPSLIIRWMRPANWVGSSRLKPEVSNEVSKSNQIKSFTVLSDLSAAAFFLNCHGLPGDFVHKFVLWTLSRYGSPSTISMISHSWSTAIHQPSNMTIIIIRLVIIVILSSALNNSSFLNLELHPSHRHQNQHQNPTKKTP